jgi:hypothetical protein
MRTVMPPHFFRTLAFLVLIFAEMARAAEVREPKVGSPERKTIMEIMRAPVSKRIGKRVTFTGSVKICGEWATCQGNVAPSDGMVPNWDAASDLSPDFSPCSASKKDDGLCCFGILPVTSAHWTRCA